MALKTTVAPTELAPLPASHAPHVVAVVLAVGEHVAVEEVHSPRTSRLRDAGRACAACIGGDILGIPLVISAAAGNRLILVDANQVAVHLGNLETEGSGEASIEMTDSPSSGSAQQTSLWQRTSVCVRLSVTATWALLADDAVSFVELSELGGSPA